MNGNTGRPTTQPTYNGGAQPTQNGAMNGNTGRPTTQPTYNGGAQPTQAER
ncbi:MAG: hypothetical protein IPN95_32430 [Bacteroidetes bacterium]|nr:hypothetical protein [Bacteroidota bacterium]